MAKFEKGKEKTGGRQKGVTNKQTSEARELFIGIMGGQVGYVEDSLNKIRIKDPAKYIDALSKLFPYFIPKMIEHSGNMDANINVNVTIE